MSLSKDIILRVLLYFSSKFPTLQLNSLRVFHSLCRVPNFRQSLDTQHALTIESFKGYISEVKTMFNEAYQKMDSDLIINCCGSVSTFA